MTVHKRYKYVYVCINMIPAESKAKEIGAVVKTLEIINYLQLSGPSGVSEISDACNLPVSTVHHHLATLQGHNYVIKRNGKYQLGLRFLGITEAIQSRRKLYEVAKPEAVEIAEETGELCTVLAEEHGLGFFLIWEESERSIQLDSHPGYGIHLHTTALGKAVLAHKPEAEVENVISKRGLPERTPHTITDSGALFEELQQIRDQGYASDENERIRGMSAYAAPIFDHDGSVRSAISIAGPTRRLSESSVRKEYIDKLQEAANVIELNIEYS